MFNFELSLRSRAGLVRGSLLIAALAMLGATSRLCLASLVVNGSFESPVVAEASGVHTTYWYEPQYIPGWTVDQVGPNGNGSSVEVYNSTGYSGWQAADGLQSADMSGHNAGSIYQDLTTVPGQRYIVSFALAGNPNTPSDPLKLLRMSWGSNDFDMEFDTTGKSRSNMGWTTETFYLTATDPTTRLRFTSLNASDAGPVIDSVSVVVPEPAVMAALWIPASAPLLRRKRQGRVAAGRATGF